MKFPIAKPHIGQSEKDRVMACLQEGWISSSGPVITDFERAFAAYHGDFHGVSTSNGTVAIQLALMALGIGPGDEVMVSDLTFSGSAAPILLLGATPVLIPSARDHWNLDVDSLTSRLNERTKAVIAVHLYGEMCNMQLLQDFCNEHDLFLIEDAAEALGASWQGKLAGCWSDISCFSFFGNKILSTGEGGMCLTANEVLAEKLLVYRDHGRKNRHTYWHDVAGINGRMTSMQAAIGLGQLERLDEILDKRRAIGKVYSDNLSDTGLFKIHRPEESCPTIWLYPAVLSDNNESIHRDSLLKLLDSIGIESRPFFHPLSSMPPYESFGPTQSPTRFWADHGFNLPTYEDLTLAETKEIAEKLADLLC